MNAIKSYIPHKVLIQDKIPIDLNGTFALSKECMAPYGPSLLSPFSRQRCRLRPQFRKAWKVSRRPSQSRTPLRQVLYRKQKKQLLLQRAYNLCVRQETTDRQTDRSGSTRNNDTLFSTLKKVVSAHQWSNLSSVMQASWQRRVKGGPKDY